MATLAPFSASARAMARPMRLAAPVTSAVLPESGLVIRWLLVRRGRCGLRWRGRLAGRRSSRPYRLLNAGLASGSLAGVVDIGGDLFLWANHGNRNLTVGLVNLVVLGEGGVAISDDLHANQAAGRDNVYDCFSIGVGFDL